MSTLKTISKSIALVLIFFILYGCASQTPAQAITPTDITPTQTPLTPTDTPTQLPPTATSVPLTNTPTPWPSLCEGVEENCIEIMYEGKDCTHVGPEIVPAGQITLIFSNHTSGSIANIDLEKLDEGKTWGSMYNYMSPLPFTGSQPDWSRDVITATGLDPGKSTTRQKELTAGTYISVCWQRGSNQTWLGGQLIVED